MRVQGSEAKQPALVYVAGKAGFGGAGEPYTEAMTTPPSEAYLWCAQPAARPFRDKPPCRPCGGSPACALRETCPCEKL